MLPSDAHSLTGSGFGRTLDAARQGDEPALSALWRELQPALLRYLRAVEPGAAEDIASDTWLEVTRRLDRFSGTERDFRGWLFTIARHRLIDARRRAARHRTAPVDWLPERPGRDDPAADVLADLSTEASLRLVSELPPEQAEAVLLRVMAGLDTERVAQIMGKQPGNVRVLSHRGLRSLARRLTVVDVGPAVNEAVAL
ncbi:MAG TPA: sigma-70 family RNA polymerase sigma factor [Acidimicrobiia bacterium]|nr:sigma-70 family RNA polymerase sigma factor [Acidimicrobiia bacterium]